MLGPNSVDEVPSGPRTRRRDNLLVAGQSVLLGAALAGAMLGTEGADWKPLSLFFALLGLALVGQFLSLRTGSVQIGPAFIATALAMALLGPAPAAVIAVAAVLAWSARARTPKPLVFNNIVALATYPVVGGLLFKALGDPGADESATFSAAAIVFVVYLATNFLNFLLIVGYLCIRDHAPLGSAVRRLYLPVVPWEQARETAFDLVVAALPARVAVGDRDRRAHRRHRARLSGDRAAGDRDARRAAVLLPLPARLGA